MLELWFRSYFQEYFVDNIAKIVAKNGLTANQITIASLWFGIISGVAIPFYPILAAVFLIFSGYLDVLDGSVARLVKSNGPIGAMLDITCDRCVECAIIGGLFAVNPIDRGACCLIMLSSILMVCTSFLLAGIFLQNQSNKSFNYSPDLMERAEAFVFFTAMIIFPRQFFLLSSVFSVLVLITAIRRFYCTISALKL